MANGHTPDKPPGQGDMGPVHTSPPRTSGKPGGQEKVEAPSNGFMQGRKPGGVGGSGFKKS